jgi:hypothetical protein
VATFIITGGRIAPEQVAGLDHNPWPTSSEYAKMIGNGLPRDA